jgi:hypothetical protein
VRDGSSSFSKRSCETQLLTLSHELLNNLHTGKQTDLIILDFSKAFDKVPHKKLFRKLDNYGIRVHEVGVIFLYLKNYIFADDTAYPMLIPRVLVYLSPFAE